LNSVARKTSKMTEDLKAIMRRGSISSCATESVGLR
jgi:hypothetical protein